MKLSIILPVFNERQTLPKILKILDGLDLGGLKKEIVIIDDASQDGTTEYIKKLSGMNIQKIFHKKNQGKGGAIRKGIKKATGDLIIIQDADLEYNPEEYKILLDEMEQKKAQVVYGSRMLKKNPYSYLSYYLGNVFLNILTSLLYRTRITDMETCYKLFKADLIKTIPLKSNRFDIEPEITSKILRKGIKIYEVPITYHPRGKEEGKKIKWRDGVIAMWILIKYKFKK